MKIFSKDKQTNKQQLKTQTYAGFTYGQIQKLAERGRKLKEIEILPPDQEMRRVTNEFLKRRVFMKRERKEKIMTALQDKDFAELPIKLLKRLKEHTGPETQKQITEIIEQKRKIRKKKRKMRKMKIREMWGSEEAMRGGMIGAWIGALIGGLIEASSIRKATGGDVDDVWIGLLSGAAIGWLIGKAIRTVIGMGIEIIRYWRRRGKRYG